MTTTLTEIAASPANTQIWEQEDSWIIPEQTIPANTNDVSTATSPLDWLDVDLNFLAANADNGSRRQNGAGLEQIARQITQSESPYLLFRQLVNYCCLVSSQDRIDLGAAILARIPHFLLRATTRLEYLDWYVEAKPTRFDRIWLYSRAFAEATDTRTQEHRIQALSEWLRDPDVGIRELAANALGCLCAAESSRELRQVLVEESSNSVREAIIDALDEIGDA